MSDITVMKFGGTSQGTMKKMGRIAEQVKGYVNDGNKVLMVVSAPSTKEYKTTNMIISAADAAKEGRMTPSEEVFVLQDKFCRELGIPTAEFDKPEYFTRELYTIKDLAGMAKNYKIIQLFEAEHILRARLHALGERRQAPIMARLLGEYGINAAHIDYEDPAFPIRAVGEPLYALPDLEKSSEISEMINWDEHDVFVIPGYGGMDKDGGIRLFSRGGSDMSALAATYATKAHGCVIGSDVNGIYNGPYPDAELIDQLSIYEAMMAGLLGAKLPNARTLRPLESCYREHRYPAVRITDAMDINNPGTAIVAKTKKRSPVQLVGSREMKRYYCKGSEFAEIIRELNASGVMPLVTINEDEMHLGVMEGYDVIEKKLKEFKNNGMLHYEEHNGNVCIVGAVGEGMTDTPGIAARVYAALGRKGINVETGYDLGKGCFTSVLVKPKDQERATRAVYDEFFSR